MLENVVYFSGPSGNGKTGLIQNLVDRNSLFLPGNPEKLNRLKHTRDKMRKFPSYFEYAIAKIDERVGNARFHATMELQHPGTVILGDRSVHDTTVYIRAGVLYGWLTPPQVNELLVYQKEKHPLELMPQKTVFLDFPLPELMAHLKRRWKMEGKGERESEEYLSIDIGLFRKHFGTLDNVLRITEKKEENIDVIESWIREIC